ncbi:MAG: RNA polymerase sigma factor [Planctomycetes bacterium]|nr:RNA polymerase sigma factor [Planctomycetota bacterium]
MERGFTPSGSGVVDAPGSAVFDHLVEPHLEALHAIARGIVGSDDLAWDAVQETLVCFWRANEAPQDVRGWLVRTVVHKSLHVDRARRRRSRHEDRAGSERVEPCPLCDPALALEHESWAVELDAALESLSAEMRAVFLLRQREGLEYEAIASALALPIGTVRSRLKRARERLAERLGVQEPRREREDGLPDMRLSGAKSSGGGARVST